MIDQNHQHSLFLNWEESAFSIILTPIPIATKAEILPIV